MMLGRDWDGALAGVATSSAPSLVVGVSGITHVTSLATDCPSDAGGAAARISLGVGSQSRKFPLLHLLDFRDAV